jgi:hypothetical protein
MIRTLFFLELRLLEISKLNIFYGCIFWLSERFDFLSSLAACLADRLVCRSVCLADEGTA